MQLHGYLTSLFACWHGEMSASVLMRRQSDYWDAYEGVRTDFSRVGWWDEETFAGDLQTIVNGTTADFLCFGVDDAVWVRNVSLSLIERTFAEHPDLLAYSLRLGRNIRSNLWAGEVPLPALKEWAGGSFAWDVTAPDSRADWAYPWEVVGTIYRTDYVRRMVDLLIHQACCNSPSQLEYYGAQQWALCRANDERMMAAPWVSSVVLPVPNRVQQEHGNPLLGGPELPPAFLLDCWQRGLREDTERFGSRVNTQIHVPDFYLRRAG